MPELNCPRCNTPVSRHEAGRCLDAWVAEAVMGEQPRRRYYSDYSTSDAAALRVAEKLRERGWNVALHLRVPTSFRRYTVACSYSVLGPSVTIFADSLALAVCRAALLACCEGDES